VRRAAQALCVAALLAALAWAQEGYWIALNYRVTFYGNGTALVEAKLHPFSIGGRSLFGDPEVERGIASSLPALRNLTLLMFSDRPRLLAHTPFSFERREGEVVMCDVANTGSMTRFQGAYVLSTLVYLNTSSFVRALNDSTFEVKVRDSFTSTDVRSWIDVIEFRFEGVELVAYRWEPPFARGPSRVGGALLWTNFNEQEAPDFYVFVLRMPRFEYVGEPAEVSARIASVRCAGGRLVVVVGNQGGASGYAYVRVVSPPGEQARKVYLRPGEEREVVFPSANCSSATVELYSGGSLLDRFACSPCGEGPPTAAELAETLAAVRRMLLITLAMVAAAVALVAALWLASRLRGGGPPPPAQPAAGGGPT